MNRLRLLLIALFLLATLAVTVSYNLNKPRLLVLHSYDPGYAWTRDASEGVQRVLSRYPHFAVRWFYMDTKRYPWPEFKAKTGLAARNAIERWRPDVVILIDDDAQDMVGRHYVNHSRIKLVFAGVNGGVDDYGYTGADNVTGIFERKDLAALKTALLSLQGMPPGRGPLRLIHIADSSGSVAHDEQRFRVFDWSPLQNRPSRLVDDFDAWKQAVREAQTESDFIVTSNYRKIRRSAADSGLVPPAEIVAWTLANSRIPVIGTNGFFVEDGGELAIGTSPFEQGEVAARMAAQLLEGQPAADIERVSTRQFVVFMRSQRLQARGLTLPPLYEAFARATNNDLQ
jgi:hypothetical protein